MTWGLSSVSVTFDRQPAFDDVSLVLERGQIAVVVGADGAGKTTLCRTMVGLVEIASGEVFRPPRTTFQPETSGVWQDLTVMENLHFVARGYGLETAHAAARIDELLEVTDLGEARQRLGRQLSGGMRQRLGVAMAVLSEPDLLVLDEPTTGLDPISRLELWSFITRSAREGRAVVVTSTYVDEASRGDTVLALDDGRVLASGSVADVVSAIPGKLYESPNRVGSDSWHRAHSWRVWSSDGSPIEGLSEVTPDIADVVTVSALRGEHR